MPPEPGDDLVFINGIGWGRGATNNFPSNTVFGSITALKYNFHFFGEALYGNPILLNAGIATSRSVTNLLNCELGIGLNANQTFEANAALRFGGVLDLRGHTLTLAGPEEITMYGRIVGSGAIIKTGTNYVWAFGSNTYSGVTHIREGRYQVYHAGLGDILSGTMVDAGAELYVIAQNMREPLTLSGTLRGEIGNWSGPIELPAGSVGRISATTIAGTIWGAGGVLFERPIGVSSMEVRGENTYTGPTFVRGPVRIHGTQPFSSVVLGSGTLSGTGLVGSISSTGNLAKIVAPGPGARTLGTRGLALDGSITLAFDLDSAPTKAFDRLAVEGSVSLNDAKLAVNVLAAPEQPGMRYTIIENDASDAIAGTFTNLLEGMTFDATNGVRFRITYQGGDGNDVAVESVAIGQSRWDGGGADNLWSTAANWQDDVVPSPGDELYFPTGAAQRTNVNDLAAGTRFHSISIYHDYALGGAVVTLDAGLQTDPGSVTVVVEMPLRLNFPQWIRADSGRLQVLGAIDNGGNDLTLVGEGQVIEVFSEITGGGGVRLAHIDEESIRVLLAGANAYSGPTYVLEQSWLDISNGLALGSPVQGTFVEKYSGLGVHDGISVPEPLTLHGTLEALGPGGVNWDGPITVADAEILANGQGIRVNGVISGGGFTKRGPGTLTLTAENIYTGQTIVRAGTLVVNGNQPASTVVLSYEPGSTVTGTLGGVGRVGNIVGASPYPGRIAPGINGAGSLSAGNVALNGGTRLSIELFGTSAGSHDQLQVNGTVALGNADLSVSLGFTPAPGDAFVIVENDGNDPVGGRFLHYAEGSAFMAGATQLQITYNGGDGNDVELRVTSGLPVVRTWDGGGADNFWTTAANWVGDVAPAPGDAVAFPEAPRKTSVNDFPAYTRFARVSIGSGDYVLSGQGVTLGQGLAASFSNGMSRITFPIRLETNQTCQAANTFGLRIEGPIDTAGWIWSLDGDGSVWISGGVSGAGGLIKAGRGDVWLAGPNTYSGETEIVRGALWLSAPYALGSAAGATVVRPGATLAIDGGSNTFTEPLVLGGTLRLNQTVTGARWTGPIELTSGEAKLWLLGERFVIDGVISGGGGLWLDGGFLVLNGANTYTGRTTINGGRLRVHGYQPQSPILSKGGRLEGTGRVGQVTLEGYYSGNINAGGATNFSGHSYNGEPGVLSVGGLSVGDFGALVFDLNGALPGSGHDQIKCFGMVNLGGVRLDIGFGFTPALGQSLTLIDNDGTDPVAGTFAGLAEGSYWSSFLTPLLLQISYIGGDGNDVVVTRVSAPPSRLETIRTFPGGQRAVAGRGIAYVRYILEGATNLNPVIQWRSIATNMADSWGVYNLTDPTAINYPMRFYRVRSE